jgi:hypothetical protein
MTLGTATLAGVGVGAAVGVPPGAFVGCGVGAGEGAGVERRLSPGGVFDGTDGRVERLERQRAAR